MNRYKSNFKETKSIIWKTYQIIENFFTKTQSLTKGESDTLSEKEIEIINKNLDIISSKIPDLNNIFDAARKRFKDKK